MLKAIDFVYKQQQVYCKSPRPSFVAVRAMSESQTATKNQPQSSASSEGFSYSWQRSARVRELPLRWRMLECLSPKLRRLLISLKWQLDGRVKTLHPNIHGGILARRDVEHHMEALNEHGIGTFDVVVVNLYPFYNKVTAPGWISFEDGIENIDIGGPAMIRAAAKNHKDVLIVVDSEDYPSVLEYLKGGQSDQQFRRKLAWKAFQHVAAYDSAVSEWLWKQTEGQEKFPPSFTVPLSLKSSLRYGENPHQKAAFYVDKSLAEVNAGGIATAIQHHGKEMSYNNYLDADAAELCPTQLAFGGIVAFNVGGRGSYEGAPRVQEPNRRETRMFYEIVVAPKYTAKGLEHVKSNAIVIAKNNCMLGMGSGQPNRVESLRLAFKKAGEEAKGAALASDAFFPFAWKDAVEEACEKGIGAIAEPGGSIRDQDAIDCCNKYGVSTLHQR
ncbi:hypothetical protein Bca52824_049054 [Brassica carinata]|uniref:MGS-like domain-containing protein n=1 Tax=Brassica carinata TaxID=52824 RepID=A0A8X7RMB6_BRACI|nr:hypothetical protein Bca52824_049054 [Brassica carinata]